MTYQPKIYKTNGGDKQVAAPGAVMERAIVKKISAGLGTPVSASGWAMPSAHSGLTVTPVAGLPASKTGSTFMLPLTDLNVGDKLTGFSVQAQIESAGGTVTLDADLRKISNIAADATDASLGAITQVSVTADTKVEASKTLSAQEVVAADADYYILFTGTTAGSTDIELICANINITEQ